MKKLICLIPVGALLEEYGKYGAVDKTIPVYVKDWQYSQGHFDVVLTNNVFYAEDFFGREYAFKELFENKGAKLQLLETTFTIKDWPENKEIC